MTTNRSTQFMIPKNELYYWDETEQVMKPLVDIDGVVQVKGQVQAEVTSSDIMQPIDIQSHYQQTIQTHTATMIAPNGSNTNSTWIDTNGFDSISVSMTNDASTNSWVSVVWSADGVNTHGMDSGLLANTQSQKSINISTKLRYAKIMIINNDATAPHTMSAWAYLKA